MRYLLMLTVFLCSFCFAKNQMYVFFLNGINTTPDDADANLTHLESLVADNPNISWNVLYNATHGMLKSDIWDVLQQKKCERLSYDVKKYLLENPKKTLKSYLYESNYVGKNLADIINQFHSQFPKDYSESYALIISHSQGNQYANQLWDYLVNGEGFPRDHIALFGIATPAAKVEGSFDYITADNDKVINIARLIPQRALEPNAHIQECKDFECHNLIKDYLSDNVIRKKICNQIGSFVNLWLNTQSLC